MYKTVHVDELSTLCIQGSLQKYKLEFIYSYDVNVHVMVYLEYNMFWPGPKNGVVTAQMSSDKQPKVDSDETQSGQ